MPAQFVHLGCIYFIYTIGWQMTIETTLLSR
jgi:hypothetical protein